MRQCSAAQFPAELLKFQHSGATGCNITLPLKGLAYELADDISGAVKAVSAANTILFANNSIYADNTDGKGWLTDLAKNSIKIKQQSVCLLGAGGAAAGLIAEIVNLQPARLVVANRDTIKAERLLRATGKVEHRVLSLDQLADDTALEFDLLINSTSLGHQGVMPSLPIGIFSPGAVFYDLNYGQAALPAQQWCAKNSINYQDGLGMLVEQAALSFSIWTGKTPSTTAILEELRVQLEQSQG